MFVEELIKKQIANFVENAEPENVGHQISKCFTNNQQLTWFVVLFYPDNKSAAFYLNDFNVTTIEKGYYKDSTLLEYRWQEFLSRIFGQSYIHKLKDHLKEKSELKNFVSPNAENQSEKLPDVKLDDEFNFTYHTEQERQARIKQIEINSLQEQINYLSGHREKYRTISHISALKSRKFDLENGKNL